jgi:hypothetical protein
MTKPVDTKETPASLYAFRAASTDTKPDAVKVADFTIEQLLKATQSPALVDIKSQLQELLTAPETDITAVIALTEKLKAGDKEQKDKEKKALELTKSFTLAEVLTAFKSQYEELVYNVGTSLLVNVSSVVGTGKVEKASGTTIQNTKGETAVMPSRRGKGAANLSQDKAVFDFLGFTIETEDGKEILIPSTLKQTDGVEVPTSRKSILDAIKTGNVKELQGFTLTEEAPAE